MLPERRFVLSLVSTNLLVSDQNVRLATTRHTLSSRHQSAHARKRCSHTLASHSLPQLGPSPKTSYLRRRRIRRRAPYLTRTAPNDAQMATNNHQEVPPTQSQRLLLPRRLVRPRFRPIDIRAVVFIDPLLDGIPLSYIQQYLKDIGPQLLRATCSATATPPSGRLPRELRLVCNDVSVEPPSHIIAAYSSVNAHVTLFPVHALVLASNCAHVPSLPWSKPDTPASPGGTVMLPVLPLRIPSLATFPRLLSYLYTKRTDQLLTELLPAQNTSSIAQLVRAHAVALSVKALIVQVRKVHGLWSNAVALGLFDDRLFRALEMAWEVLLGALARNSGQSVDTGINIDGELE